MLRPAISSLLTLWIGVTPLACRPHVLPSSFLYTSGELRERFGVDRDSLPEIVGDRATRAASTAIASIEPFGFAPDSTCTRVFDASPRIVVYAWSGCSNGVRVIQHADGDALVLVGASGDSVLATLLMPGGTEVREPQ